MTVRWWFYPLVLLTSLALVAVGIVMLTVILLYPNLPSIEAVTDYRPKLPLRVLRATAKLSASLARKSVPLSAFRISPQS